MANLYKEIPSNEIGDSFSVLKSTLSIGDSGAPGNFPVAAIEAVVDNNRGDSINANAILVKGGKIKFGDTLSGFEFSDGVIITSVGKKFYIQDGKIQIQPVSASGTSPHDTYTSTYEALRIIGTTSDYIISLQDGTGRVQHYWNCRPGTGAEVYLVGEEDAFKMLFSVNGIFRISWASGSGKIAGDTITWITILDITPTIFQYLNNTVWHSGNDGTGTELDADKVDGKHAPANGDIVGTSQSQTLTNKILTNPDINGGTVDAITSLTTANITLGGGTQVKKLTISTSAPSGGVDGDLWFVREA